MAAESTLRDSINTSDANRSDSAFNALQLGELLTLLIQASTPTESSVTVTSNVATLAATPTALFQCNASAGTTTGVKKLLIGPATIVPATGQCLWTPGTNTVKFNVADAVSAAHFLYSTAVISSSAMLRSIGEQD